MKNIFRILKYMFKFKKEFVLNIIFNILHVFFSLFSIATVVPLVAILFGVVDAPQQCPDLSFNKDALVGYVSFQLNDLRLSKGIFTSLIYISIMFIIFTFISNLCRYMAMFFLTPIRNGLVMYLRNDIYKKITILPVSFFSKQKNGDIISRFTTDLADVEWCVTTCLQMIIKDPVMIIVYATVLLLTNWKFVVFIIVILPLPMFLIKKIGESLSRNSIKGQTKSGNMLAFAEESLSMIKVTKSLNAEQKMQDKFSDYNDSYTKTMNRVIARNELASPLTEYFSMIILAIVVVFGGLLVINGQMNAGILIGFTVIFSRIISPVKELITAYYNLKKGEAAAKRIYGILDADEDILEKSDAIRKTDFTDEIKFENVGFSYKGHSGFALQDLNFTIKKGQKVALVGGSGAGKTTIMDLLERFIDVTQGKITIDGIDIRDLCINDLRSLTAIVPQDSILFNDTVKNNISFAKPDATEQEILQVSKIANTDSFIKKLPLGYDTVVGDMAVSLSGGQRQRLCIARALLKNPQILLLDEATGSMDSENERKITSSLLDITDGKTMIIIAHRLSTVVNCDNIIVMSEGKIVEQGTHGFLMQQNGYYAKLVKLQTL